MDRVRADQVIVAEVAALRHELATVRAEMLDGFRAIREALPRPSPDDQAKLGALLEILDVGVELTAKRLQEAAGDRKNESLRNAMVLISGENPKTAQRRLGSFLADMAKHGVRAVSGKRLERVRRAGDGELYRVVGVVDRTTCATLEKWGDHGSERRRGS